MVNNSYKSLQKYHMKNNFTNLKFQKKRFLEFIKHFSSKEQKYILKAYEIARKAHFKQERDEGTPYIIHPLRVASYLIEQLNVRNFEVICAALLHDVLEDSDLKIEEIRSNLSSHIAQIVSDLTRYKREDETLENKYEKKYKKFLETMKKPIEVRMIKACDWLDNMRSWQYIPKDHPAREKKFPRWFKEAETMYIPLAKTVNEKIAIEMKNILTKMRKNQFIKNPNNI